MMRQPIPRSVYIAAYMMLLVVMALEGCAKQPATETKDAAKASEEEKLQRRREITALYEEWHNNEQKAIVAEKAMERLRGRDEEKGYQMFERDREFFRDNMDKLDQQSKQKYGVPARELPRLYAP